MQPYETLKLASSWPLETIPVWESQLMTKGEFCLRKQADITPSAWLKAIGDEIFRDPFPEEYAPWVFDQFSSFRLPHPHINLLTSLLSRLQSDFTFDQLKPVPSINSNHYFFHDRISDMPLNISYRVLSSKVSMVTVQALEVRNALENPLVVQYYYEQLVPGSLTGKQDIAMHIGVFMPVVSPFDNTDELWGLAQTWRTKF